MPARSILCLVLETISRNVNWYNKQYCVGSIVFVKCNLSVHILPQKLNHFTMLPYWSNIMYIFQNFCSFSLQNTLNYNTCTCMHCHGNISVPASIIHACIMCYFVSRTLRSLYHKTRYLSIISSAHTSVSTD